MSAHRRSKDYKRTRDGGTVVTDEWVIDEPDVYVAEDDADLPQVGDFHDEYTIAVCVSQHVREDPKGPNATQCIGTVVFKTDVGDTDSATAALTIDLMTETVRQYSDLDDPTRGIGVNQEGVPAERPTETIQYQNVESSLSKSTIESLQAHVNDASWKGYGAGRVLFLGARARNADFDGSGDWDVTYYFKVARSGDTHQAVWQPYEEETATEGGKQIVKRTYGTEQSARRYPSGDFDQLPI